MLSKDLFRLLTNLGEKLTKEEAKGLMNEMGTPRMLRASPPSCLSWKGCARTTLHKQFLNETKHKRISGSRVLGRLKKSCKCCGNPDIYAIHLLPTAYPSKKLANSREKKKKRKKILKKNISRFNGGAQNSSYSHSFCLREKTSNQFEKNLFPPPFVF